MSKVKEEAKKQLKKKIRKTVVKFLFWIIKPFIVPILIIVAFFTLISSITDILHISFKHDDEKEIKENLKYYDTDYEEERDKEEVKGFFASVWDFVSNLFGGLEKSYETDWPVEGHYNISSGFGNRESPTSGASTFHTGVDIPAPEGTKLVCIMDGEVVSVGWGGADGYSITIKGTIDEDNYRFTYGHVSPEFMVSTGQEVKKGEVIGKVGPKNVYGITNNPYKDDKGNPTNGATTGCHCHFSIRKNGELIDPLTILKKKEGIFA